MNYLRKHSLLAVSTVPCIFYAYLTVTYFLLVDWSASSSYWLLGLVIAIATLLALALSLYVEGRIARNAMGSGLRILDLAGIHLRIFGACLIAYFAFGLASSPFRDRWRESGHITEQFWFASLIGWSITVLFSLIYFLIAGWLGKIAWDMIKEIPAVLMKERASTPEPSPVPTAK